MDYVLLAVFLGLTMLGVPVAYTLCLSVATILVFFIDKPLVMVSQIMYSGIDSFSFMAVPFFMLAGSFRRFRCPAASSRRFPGLLRRRRRHSAPR